MINTPHDKYFICDIAPAFKNDSRGLKFQTGYRLCLRTFKDSQWQETTITTYWWKHCCWSITEWMWLLKKEMWINKKLAYNGVNTSSSKVLWKETVVGKTLEKVHGTKILDEKVEVFPLS